jgi:hypothetical protein
MSELVKYQERLQFEDERVDCFGPPVIRIFMTFKYARWKTDIPIADKVQWDIILGRGSSLYYDGPG